VLSDCEGAFGGFHAQDLAGVGAAFAEFAGATITDPTDPVAGFTGASVAGVPVELVGVGCADDTADKAIEETRRLMEQLGADIMIGPLSGDESVAVANYAKDHPNQTFVNGTAGAMDTTLDVQAPNFFRYNGDGAQWNAGSGDFAKNVLGWDTAAIWMDDYSFAWTSAAGFIAEFCAAGGVIEDAHRVFPPLNNADYAQFAAQLPGPDEVDGYFWAIGGDTLASIKAFEDAHGPLQPDAHIGNLFFEFVTGQLDPSMEGAYVGGFGTAGDLAVPSVAEHTAILERHFTEFPDPGGNIAPAGAQAHSGFLVNYFVAAKTLIQALEAVGGDISDGHAALQAELAGITVEGPYGTITLDENRQAIQDQFVRQMVLNDDGSLGLATVAIVPAVDQSFGAAFTKEGGMPSREIPTCEVRDVPWIGNSIPVVDGVPQG
jgi:branched-chain amino acid transport system substrate-binding protein